MGVLLLSTTGSWSILFFRNILYASDARQPVVMDFGFLVITSLIAFQDRHVLLQKNAANVKECPYLLMWPKFSGL